MEKEKDFVNQQFRKLKFLVRRLKWEQIQAKKDALRFLDGDRLEFFIWYLQKSAFDYTQTHVDHLYVMESLTNKDAKKEKQSEGIKTPRTIKYIVNESLRLIDDNSLFLQDFFTDLERLMYSESQDSSIIGGPLRTDFDIKSINSSAFEKRLEKNLKSCTFIENV